MIASVDVRGSSLLDQIERIVQGDAEGDPVIAICHPLACLAFGSFVLLVALDVLGFAPAKQAFSGTQEWLRSWTH